MSTKRFTRSFRSMIAWQEAHKLTILIYKITNTFPKSEVFAMSSQLRRAAYSIETQLAEGAQMQTSAHKLAFYARALGSVTEVDNFLELALDLNYVTTSQYDIALELVNKSAYLINKLIASLKPNQRT